MPGFRKGFKGKGKKSSFVRVGNMFKSEKEYTPEGASYAYGTTVHGEYLTPVAELVAKAEAEGGSIRFSLTKWDNAENPVLSVNPVASKPGKRITKAKEDGGLEGGQDIN